MRAGVGDGQGGGGWDTSSCQASQRALTWSELVITLWAWGQGEGVLGKKRKLGG